MICRIFVIVSTSHIHALCSGYIYRITAVKSVNPKFGSLNDFSPFFLALLMISPPFLLLYSQRSQLSNTVDTVVT